MTKGNSKQRINEILWEAENVVRSQMFSGNNLDNIVKALVSAVFKAVKTILEEELENE